MIGSTNSGIARSAKKQMPYAWWLQIYQKRKKKNTVSPHPLTNLYLMQNNIVNFQVSNVDLFTGSNFWEALPTTCAKGVAPIAQSGSTKSPRPPTHHCIKSYFHTIHTC